CTSCGSGVECRQGQWMAFADGPCGSGSAACDPCAFDRPGCGDPRRPDGGYGDGAPDVTPGWTIGDSGLSDTGPAYRHTGDGSMPQEAGPCIPCPSCDVGVEYIASGTWPHSVAVNGDYVYWTNWGGYSTGGVARKHKTLGGTETLVVSDGRPVTLAVDDGFV